MTVVLGGAHPLSPDVPSKGPRCNSNISAIRFEGLNCQERMMAATGRRGCKKAGEIALGGSFHGAVARRASLPCGGGDCV